MSSHGDEVVIVGPKTYNFPRLPHETDEVYGARASFFMRRDLKTEKKYAEAIKLSMIWANVKFLGCVYQPDVMKSVEQK